MKIVVPLITGQVVPGLWCSLFVCECCGGRYWLSFGYPTAEAAQAAAGEQIAALFEENG